MILGEVEGPARLLDVQRDVQVDELALSVARRAEGKR